MEKLYFFNFGINFWSMKREGLYREVVPYLEKSLGIDGDDVEVLNTLKNIYGTLGETERFREIKAKIEALEQ